MKIRLAGSFEREFVKVTKGNLPLKKQVLKQLEVVLKNPNHPSLRLHKLEGESYWSISINRSIRVLLLFEKDAVVVYHIGKHEDVY